MQGATAEHARMRRRALRGSGVILGTCAVLALHGGALAQPAPAPAPTAPAPTAPAPTAAPPVVQPAPTTAPTPVYPPGTPPPYPQQPYPQQYPQGYPQQPYPQQYPQGYPQQYPQRYPQQPYPQQYPQGYPQQPYPQQPYPQQYPQQYPQGYPQGYPPGYYPPGVPPPGYYPPGYAPPAYYGPGDGQAQPVGPKRRPPVDVKAVVSGSVLLGVAWSLSSIMAVVVIDSNNGDARGTEPLFIPVIGPFIAAGTTGSFDQKNNASDLGFLLIADGLAQVGGLVSIMVGSLAGNSGSSWMRGPAVPEVNVGLGTTRLKWQF